MIMALNKAAIRLAHLVDGMALALEEQKPPETPVRIRKEAKLFETKISADPSFNRFEILRIDLKDTEPLAESTVVLVESEESAKKDATTEKCVSGKKKQKGGKSKKHSNKKVQKKKEDEYFNQVMDAHDAKTRYEFEGIDLSSIQVIDFNGFDVITSRTNAQVPDYQPSGATSFRVAFDRNGSKEPKMYFFDGAVFDSNMSTELAIRCILKVSGVSVDGKSDIGRYWTPSTTGKDIVEKISVLPPPIATEPEPSRDASMAEKLQDLVEKDMETHIRIYRESLISQRSAEIERKFLEWKKTNKSQDLTIYDMWKEEIEKKRSKILGFKVSADFIFVLEDTIKKSATNIMRFPIYTLINADGDLYRVMIDPEIFEGKQLQPLLSIFMSIYSENKKFADSLLVNDHQTWLPALIEIHMGLKEKDLNRVEKFEFLQRFDYFKSTLAPFYAEWAMMLVPREAIYPPGWDWNRVTKRYIKELMLEEEKASIRTTKKRFIRPNLGTDTTTPKPGQ
jgi:hypothetical protein